MNLNLKNAVIVSAPTSFVTKDEHGVPFQSEKTGEPMAFTNGWGAEKALSIKLEDGTILRVTGNKRGGLTLTQVNPDAPAPAPKSTGPATKVPLEQLVAEQVAAAMKAALPSIIEAVKPVKRQRVVTADGGTK